MGFRRGQRSQGRPTGGDIRGNFFGNLSNNQEPGAWDAFLANSMPQISPWLGSYGGNDSEPDPFYNPGQAPFFPRYPGAELPNLEGGRGGSELDWLPQPPTRMPWDRFPSQRPPFSPPSFPPQ